MASREWTVSGHTVSVWHRFWSGKAEISVDGIPIIYRPSPPLTIDFGFIRCFDVDGTRCAVRVMPNWYCTFQIDLFVGPEAERLQDSDCAPVLQALLGLGLFMFCTMACILAFLVSSVIRR